MTRADLDHVGIAVDDAGGSLRRIYGTGVLLPVAGEEDDEFRWVLGRRHEVDRGIRVELLDPNGSLSGFLARHLRSHGEGAHHLTFMVDDIHQTLDCLRDARIPTTQIDLEYPPWREAFIHPHSGLGTVVQVASSIYTYPAGCQHGKFTDAERMPHRRTGRHRDWWRRVLDVDAEPRCSTVRNVSLAVADAGCARVLFEVVLGGRRTAEGPGFTRYEWRSGSITAVVGEIPGINAVHFETDGEDPPGDFALGRTPFRRITRGHNDCVS